MADFLISTDGENWKDVKTSDNLQFSNMIQANELRIGNLVYWSDGEPIKINTGTDIEYHENYSPIPLTAEILEKCGFIKDENAYNKLNVGSFGFRWKNEYFYLIVESDWQEVDVKYLHQLQNLYFSLTGTELEIKKFTVA